MSKFGIDKIYKLASIEHLIKSIIILLVISFSNIAVADGGSMTVYQGTLSGEWSGRVHEMSVSGIFSIKISANGVVSGTYSGTQSGTISGSLSSSGRISAQGSAGISEWIGKVSISEGRLSGSGTWSGYGGGGEWSSK